MTSRNLGLWMATITALSWAVLAIGLKLALNSFSSGTIVWFRLIVAFSILLVAFAWRRREWLSILYRPPWLGLAAGCLIAANYFGFMKGVELTSASNAQILIQLAPLSFAILSILIYREIPTRMQMIGMVIAGAGFAFFYWDQLLLSLGESSRFQQGNIWLLIAAATWTVYALLQKRLLATYRPQQFNLLIYGISAILLFPTADLAEITNASLGGILLAIFLAVNTVVAYGALGEALNLIPASHVSMIISMNPLLTIFIMTILTRMEVGWIRGEPIGWRGLVGAGLVVIGVVSTVYTPPRLRKDKLIN